MTTPVGNRPEVRSAVEPRIVERRRGVETASHRRRTRRRVALAAAVAVFAGAAALAFSPVADLDRVVVTGTSQLDDDGVARIAGLEPGRALLAIDLATARDRLLADPGVAAATVEREWPGTVRVSIVEERPVAAVAVGDGARVVAISGRVLGAGVAADGLPLVELAGVEVPEEGDRLDERARRVVALLADLRPELAGQLVGVRLDDSGDLQLDVDGGASVRFGPLEDVPAKLLAIETVFDRVVQECLAVLDVREPTRPAVSRADGCAAPEPTEPLVAPSEEPSDESGDPTRPTDATDGAGATGEPA